jgi:hypothetical protein
MARQVVARFFNRPPVALKFIGKTVFLSTLPPDYAHLSFLAACGKYLPRARPTFAPNFF